MFIHMTNDTVIIFSSSRSHGNTRKAVDALFPESQPKLIDLNKNFKAKSTISMIDNRPGSIYTHLLMFDNISYTS